ncbi:MAG TPA: hypothetical protein VF263_19265 [Longimicrobiaceae bacterium]
MPEHHEHSNLLFTREEIAAAFSFMYSEEDARTLAAEFGDVMAGGPVSMDDDFLTLLSLVSDDCAIRAGRFRGETPEQALDRKREFLAANGDPSTWIIEFDDNELE